MNLILTSNACKEADYFFMHVLGLQAKYMHKKSTCLYIQAFMIFILFKSFSRIVFDFDKCQKIIFKIISSFQVLKWKIKFLFEI